VAVFSRLCGGRGDFDAIDVVPPLETVTPLRKILFYQNKKNVQIEFGESHRIV
jgi:hypothetical protein